jgi:integration host factor subunit alpha
MTKTLTRLELAESLYSAAGLTRKEANSVLEAIIDEISKGLSKDQKVKISSFGTFCVHSKSERIGRNPKTGREVLIEPRKSLSFHASPYLKDSVANNKNKKKQ